MNLQGKVVLITGSGQGIGAAIARRFVAEGACVGVSDVTLKPVEELAAELTADGPGQAIAMVLNVTKAPDWDRAIAALTKTFGGVDILINNAGIYETTAFEDISDTAWDQMMQVNAKGPFLGCRAVMSSMRNRGGGAIVNVSSMAGITGSAVAHYGASKGAVRLLTKSVALIGAPDNIRCNSVHPGMVETPMAQTAVARPGSREQRLERLPLGRFADPAEIANVVVFLASDQSSFMTGAEVAVDGGAALT